MNTATDTTTNELPQTHALTIAEPRDTAVMPGFNSQGSWELANRIGKAFAASSLVPQQYQGNVPNCIIAMEMAERMGASPMMVMQNLYIVHGNPGWSSKFLIASFNQCGRFSALRYDWSQDRTRCRAWAIEKATGDRIDGPEVTMEMATLEGWSTKSGSKWKTMPALLGVAPPQLERPEPPVFDPAAFIARIAACTDLQTLQLFSDEAESLPAGEEREAVLAALLRRDQELAAA